MKENNNATISYILWCGCFFGACGLHRLYNGKITSGLVWLCTFGVFGFGQFIDIFLIPGMVQERNYRLFLKSGGTNIKGTFYDTTAVPTQVLDQNELSQEKLMVKLAQIASQKGGRISVTQAVIETEQDFEKVESTLKMMLKKGYVDVVNDHHTGVVLYEFIDLQ
jgi:TM2 domain-containing membrane protein YozV